MDKWHHIPKKETLLIIRLFSVLVSGLNFFLKRLGLGIFLTLPSVKLLKNLEDRQCVKDNLEYTQMQRAKMCQALLPIYGNTAHNGNQR